MASCFGAGLLYGAMGRASQGQGGLAESGVIAESNMARAANVESFVNIVFGLQSTMRPMSGARHYGSNKTQRIRGIMILFP